MSAATAPAAAPPPLPPSSSLYSSSPPAAAPLFSARPASMLQSPNAIPPRTSSNSQNMAAPALNTANHAPTKSALRPVPEADWLSSARRGRNSSVSSAAVFSYSMQPPPPPDPNRYATEDLNFTAKKTWTGEKERVICGPFDYLSEHKGKEFRTQLINAFNVYLEVPQHSLDVIQRVVGMLHTASLLIDDVEDYSSLRRGIPVAHGIFGMPQTINSANYIYFLALQEIQKLNNTKALAVFSEELLNLHRGQGMDLFWRDTLTCPSEDDYLEMVGNKTGGLFRLGIKLMQAESAAQVDCVPLVNIMGLIFQIQDDYRNLFSKEYTKNKGMCEDLTEGKFSFPVIHSIRADPSNLQLLNILRQKTENEDVKRYAVSYMDGTGSFDYTRRVVAVLIDRARRMVGEIDDGKGGNVGINAILDRMVIEDE